jgi:outer membrane protein TolC
MTIRPLSAVVVGGLLLCSVGEAQTQPSAPGAAQYIDSADGLSLAQAIALAMAQEPSLQGARAEADMALAMQTQARARPNPMVSFSQQGEPAGMDNQTHRGGVALDLFRQTGRAAVAEREQPSPA